MKPTEQNAFFVVARRQYQALFQILSYSHKALILTVLVQFRCSQTMMHRELWTGLQAAQMSVMHAACQSWKNPCFYHQFTMPKEEGEAGRQWPGVTHQLRMRAAERTRVSSFSVSPFRCAELCLMSFSLRNFQARTSLVSA